jgi:two-component system, NtrC family, response regulator GlrR
MPPPDSNKRSDVLPRDTSSAAATARQEKLKAKIALAQIVGESPAFLAQLEKLPRFAASKATVLISGESGTGKEVFARALHYLSPRAGGPFVPVNCGALPEQLVESEIFGHKRGAFTGALADQAGLIQQAESGTLFLDEVDALTRPAQVKLLRLLQDGEYRAVGGQGVVRGNIRIIAASNANLARLVSDGGFREDLFYRLNVLELVLPPLRERRGDIPLLADHLLEKEAALSGTPPKKMALAALNRLFAHSWPGNVRELENVLTRAVVLCDDDTITPAHLNLPGDGAPEESGSFRQTKARVVRRFEHDFLEAVLRAHEGNITQAARAVHKNRRAFWELLRKHGLVAGRKRK